MFGTKFLVTYFKKWKNTIERLVWACVFKKNLCFICCQYHLGLMIFKIITIMLLKTIIQKLKTTLNEFSKYNVQSLNILNWELWFKHSYQTYIFFFKFIIFSIYTLKPVVWIHCQTGPGLFFCFSFCVCEFFFLFFF